MLTFSAYGGTTSLYFYLPDPIAWNATLDSAASSWLTLAAPTSGQGSSLLTLTAQRSTGPERTATLTLSAKHKNFPVAYTISQLTAEPLATLNQNVLQVPFPDCPRVLELGIAGKFIADQIKKVEPPPLKAIVLIIVEVVIVALGAIAILLRAALAAVVPEPKTWFGAPPPYDALTLALPATAVCITEETYLLATYVLKEAAS